MKTQLDNRSISSWISNECTINITIYTTRDSNYKVLCFTTQYMSHLSEAKDTVVKLRYKSDKDWVSEWVSEQLVKASKRRMRALTESKDK